MFIHFLPDGREVPAFQLPILFNVVFSSDDNKPLVILVVRVNNVP